MTYDPNPLAPPGSQSFVAGWMRPMHPGPTGAHPGGDDALINLAGVVLVALAVLTLATTAAALVGVPALIATRLPIWLLWQLPLGAPLGVTRWPASPPTASPTWPPPS